MDLCTHAVCLHVTSTQLCFSFQPQHWCLNISIKRVLFDSEQYRIFVKTVLEVDQRNEHKWKPEIKQLKFLTDGVIDAFLQGQLQTFTPLGAAWHRTKEGVPQTWAFISDKRSPDLGCCIISSQSPLSKPQRRMPIKISSRRYKTFFTHLFVQTPTF